MRQFRLVVTRIVFLDIHSFGAIEYAHYEAGKVQAEKDHL
jgi:hypothetical protein